MYRDSIVCQEADLLIHLKNGYEVAAIYYRDNDSLVEDKEIETNHMYQRNGGYSYNYSSSSSSPVETVKKVIVRTVLRKVPMFVLTRSKVEKVLYGDTNENDS